MVVCVTLAMVITSSGCGPAPVLTTVEVRVPTAPPKPKVPEAPAQPKLQVVETGYKEVNGTRLYYEASGEGEPVVLLHGLGANTSIWDETFSGLSKQHRVIRYDMRGYGRSDPYTAAPYTHEGDLRALLQSLSIDKAHIMGQSYGALQALNYTLAYPDSTASLIMVGLGSLPGAEGLPPPPEALGKAGAAMGAALATGNLEAAGRAALDMPGFGIVKEDAALSERLVDIFVFHWEHHLGHTDPDPLLPPKAPQAQRLAEIRVPVLNILGELDTETRHVEAILVQTGIPHALQVDIAGCDHLAFWEAPEIFNAIVGHFLDQVSEQG
jgi:pimeloyl-ACP methyl ester carboxylesterase